MDYLIRLWSQYLVHVVDILLVAFVFYKTLLLIRGTRAVQIAVGIVIIAGMTLLAEFLQFPALHWLLQKFWIASVVILAVVFQPEIRTGLASLGARPSSRLTGHEESFVVNEIVAAVKEASRRQMGMLIAIERDTGLREYVETGTPLHADVSRELLLTIFQPPAPLHDGAVIVQGSRLVGAGCILPVAQDASLSKLLGTRHRAAVGITEVSDAWAVCVSEETGNVSLASDGKLITDVDPDHLRERLLNVFNPQKPTRQKTAIA